MRIVVLVLTPFAVLLGSATPSPDDLLTWVAEPMEVRVACPEPFDPVQVNHLVGRPITFEPPGLDPAALRIAAARLDDDGRTLILATDPHPRDTSYGLPEPRLGDPWIYAPRGVEVTWTEAEAAESTWSSWWPVLDSDASRTATVEHSPSHRRTFERLTRHPRLAPRRPRHDPPGGRRTLRGHGQLRPRRDRPDGRHLPRGVGLRGDHRARRAFPHDPDRPRRQGPDPPRPRPPRGRARVPADRPRPADPALGPAHPAGFGRGPRAPLRPHRRRPQTRRGRLLRR
jgi:hypothetical protein